MRLVFDCNVLVSAALTPDSIPSRAFKLGQSEHEILLSFSTLLEIKETLNKPKLRKYILPKEKLIFLRKLKDKSIIMDITESLNVCRDPKDDMYLELALSGKADIIVSGDKDLLVLDPFRSIRVISPKEFLDQY